MYGFSRSIVGAGTLLVAGVVLSSGQRVHATAFAAEVISYDKGAGTSGVYQSPNSALGGPDEVTGEKGGFPNVLNPFSPPYEGDEIVQVGETGTLTLRLQNFVTPVATGPEIGIYENVGLAAKNFSVGSTNNPATTFGSDSAVVEVSADNNTWVPLNGGNPILFDLPTSYYRNGRPDDTGAPLADFGLPFVGSLSDFNGKPSYTSVLDVLGGSGGGTWLDIESSGLEKVGYIRFSVPNDGTNAAQTLEIDAVSVATNATGAPTPVPEPMAGLLLVAGIAMLGRRRRTE